MGPAKRRRKTQAHGHESLGPLGNPSLRGQLEALLEDQSQWTGFAALGALCALPKPDDAPDLGTPVSLAARLYVHLLADAPQSPDLGAEIRSAIRRAQRIRPPLNARPLLLAEREIEYLLWAIGGKVAPGQFKYPSTISTRSVTTWLMLQPDHEYILKSARRLDHHDNVSPRLQLWDLAMCRLVFNEGHTDLVPVAILLLHSEYPYVRLRAVKLLRKLSGERHEYDPHARYVERLAAASRWRRWWKQEQGKHTLKLPQEAEEIF